MRLNAQKVAPEGVAAVVGLSKYLDTSSIEPELRHLVELRVSQINGCAYCIDLHLGQLRELGVNQQKLDLLQVWREIPFYTDRENAALEWAEAVTLLADTDVPDEIYDGMMSIFSEKELFDLNMVVVTINAWNRIAIPFHQLPAKRK
jgi:AhpD family alkylhydroperoxidase